MVDKEKKVDFSLVSYILGIASIVMAIFNSFAGVTFGVIGLLQARKQKTELSKKAKKLNLIGIIAGVVLFVISMIITLYFSNLNLSNFPVA